MSAQHRKRLEQVRTEAIGLAAAATKMSQAINEVLEDGGTAAIQPQVNFITGAFARLLKDWGVVEHLQGLGVQQKKSQRIR